MSFSHKSLLSKFLAGVACVATLTALAAAVTGPQAAAPAQATAPAPAPSGVALLLTTP